MTATRLRPEPVSTASSCGQAGGVGDQQQPQAEGDGDAEADAGDDVAEVVDAEEDPARADAETEQHEDRDQDAATPAAMGHDDRHEHGDREEHRRAGRVTAREGEPADLVQRLVEDRTIALEDQLEQRVAADRDDAADDDPQRHPLLAAHRARTRHRAASAMPHHRLLKTIATTSRKSTKPGRLSAEVVCGVADVVVERLERRPSRWRPGSRGRRTGRSARRSRA